MGRLEKWQETNWDNICEAYNETAKSHSRAVSATLALSGLLATHASKEGNLDPVMVGGLSDLLRVLSDGLFYDVNHYHDMATVAKKISVGDMSVAEVGK
ncbi:hypothetical protein [Noviherbaspirillum sp.]|uniref:hypothetical protein n=1 Tax=Noviherbaspirillum sp. TaxID=1926288 RepID=UPI002B45DCC5|nr:hypothetical protein [Noviherbaspirillum sp.]HJV81611.1 hypothetical protein [Noviherbaspirillum sp.]